MSVKQLVFFLVSVEFLSDLIIRLTPTQHSKLHNMKVALIGYLINGDTVGLYFQFQRLNHPV